jgi:hypothetical protein
MELNIDTVSNLVTRILPLHDFGFAESVKTNSMIIYNSQWCRVKFYIEIDRNDMILRVGYGRLHAPDNDWVSKWNGEDYYFWNNDTGDLELVFLFLDGISYEDAFNIKRIKQESHWLFERFDGSELAQQLFRKPEEKTIQWNALVWQQYGTRLFEVFDLRRPSIWQKYIDFITNYYKLRDEKLEEALKKKGLSLGPYPNRYTPPYKRC